MWHWTRCAVWGETPSRRSIDGGVVIKGGKWHVPTTEGPGSNSMHSHPVGWVVYVSVRVAKYIILQHSARLDHG